MEGGDDDRRFAVGVMGKEGGRNGPTVWNAAFHSVQFWDGRARSLEEQAKGPMVNAVEMGMPNHQAVMERIAAIPDYRSAFTTVFGNKDPLTIQNATRAIAAYERTLITPNTPYDRFVRGDKKAMSIQAQAGMKLFGEIGCTSCHSGPNFDGPPLPEGQGFFQRFPTYKDNEYVARYKLMDDKGKAMATGKEEDEHLFRVPTLRQVALTAPYFHNGSVDNLPEAVRVMARVQLNKKLDDTQVTQLVSFLESLSGGFPMQTLPRLPTLPGQTILKDK
jgi:cytochrome c peroxidase